MPFRIIIVVAAVLMAVSGCGRKPQSTSRLESLRAEAVGHVLKRDFYKSDSVGEILYKEALREGNDIYMAYGLLSQSFYSYQPGDEGDRRKLKAEAALAKALETDNDTLLSRVYNVLGTYATLHDYDFAQAVHYYTEAKKHAEATGARDFAMSAECNISEIYHSVGDTLGLPYDLDIYDFAKETSNQGLLLPAAQHLAEHYLKSPSTAHKALRYISDIDSNQNTYLYNRLMGDYHLALGNQAMAQKRFDAAIEDETGSPGVFLSYASLLHAKGDYAGSLEMLRKAEARLSESSIQNPYKMELHRLYADDYDHLGMSHEALANLEKYIAIRDTMQQLRNQEQVNRFRIRYELGKKELEIARSQAGIRTRNIIIVSVILLAMLTVVGVVIYFRRRNQLLSVIVERQKEVLNLRKDEKDSVAGADDVALASVPESVHDVHSVSDDKEGGMSEAKKNEIWARIQREMDHNRIYADNTVSRDMFAERVGCNHTWFSQVIKERTGKTYPQFMNSRRVEESLVMLSDPQSDITHEELWRSLGFLSKATFYSSFKAQMAMSPAEYRRRVLTSE